MPPNPAPIDEDGPGMTPPRDVIGEPARMGVRYNELIGNTPLIDLSHLASPKVAGVRVFGKAEFLNPGFSIKDRIVRNILDTAEADGELRPGMTVVAASSGNTGAATAMMCAMRGYKCIITTNRKCSAEKQNSIKAYGAELLVTPDGVPITSPDHYMNVPRTLIAENPEMYFDIDQYDNLKNPEGHYKSLGPEIMSQTRGTVTHFLAGGSTGGTISGVGRYLKERKPDVQLIMPDPVGSIFKEAYESGGSHGKPKKFLVEGVGKDTIPGALDLKLVDGVVEVRDEDAFRMCHQLARCEGLLVGGSAGLNMHAAIELANSVEEPACIVTVLCDTGIKYLTKVYNPEYLAENNIDVSDVGLKKKGAEPVAEEQLAR
jgi:cysteine synthase